MNNALFVVILNFNGYCDTLACVNSVMASDYEDCTIVVVDNASTDNSYEILRKNLSSKVVLLKSENNIGYAGGNNLGIKYALEHGAEFICVLNNDTVIQSNALSECVDVLQKNPKMGFVGPAILEFSGDQVQSTGGDIRLQKGFVSLKNNGTDPARLEPLIRCDYVGGACLVFRTALLEKVGLIPENYFLFFEETEWCHRAAKLGYENWCVGTARVLHKGSASIDAVGGLHEYLMERNRVVFVRRNSDSAVHYWIYLLYQLLSDVKNALFGDKNRWNHLRYHLDGMLNRVNYKKYPFIVIKKD